jgi:hypothetical protein
MGDDKFADRFAGVYYLDSGREIKVHGCEDSITRVISISLSFISSLLSILYLFLDLVSCFVAYLFQVLRTLVIHSFHCATPSPAYS